MSEGGVFEVRGVLEGGVSGVSKGCVGGRCVWRG